MSPELETFILTTFKAAYSDFPEGDVIHGNSPDFVLTTGNKVIGIEIAEVFQDSPGCSRCSEGHLELWINVVLRTTVFEKDNSSKGC